jgi:predicted ATPase/DNA-binding XRE family transcriptional regulator
VSGQRVELGAVADASFRTRLRRLREAAGLTQEELAARAGLSPNAVGALERGARRRPYPHTVRSLAEALGLSESERAALLASVPRRGAAAAPAAPAIATELAVTVPHTPLLGRERELEEIEAFLRDPGVRLLTLTGTGGVGKTRLAIQAARDTAELFPDGAVFVALAPLDDPSLVVPTIARSLGLREAECQTPGEALRARLRGRRLLLVLDNFEHLLEAAPEVAELIEACPDLVVLATSRAPLHVGGEQEYPVGPLALPASTRSPAAEEVLGSPSGRLFAERARAVSPAFRLERGNAAVVAAICWRLAGLPLALELAAARVRFLDPATLLARLDRALSAPSGARDLPERQRTMWATLDWSYDLLPEAERALFRRLSVFAGGFSLEAAEEVGASGSIAAEDVLELLGRLVEQSLVAAEPAGEEGGVRYGMLEPVRQYAREKLVESGEAEDAQRRHAAYFLRLAEEAEPALIGPEEEVWMDRLQREHDNLRAALRWAKERGEVEAGLRLVGALNWFWWMRGYLAEGRGWIEGFLEAACNLGVAEGTRARALLGAGRLALAQGDLDRSFTFYEQSLAAYRRLGDEAGTAGLLAELGQVARARGDDERAEALSEEGLRLSRALQDRRSAAISLITLGNIARRRGDLDRAADLFEEALALFKELGHGRGVAYSLCNLGVVALERGEAGRALELHRQSLRLYEALKDKAGRAFALTNLGDTVHALGEEDRAFSLYEESLALHRKLGNKRGIARALDHLERGRQSAELREA